jgi:YggT family protein
MISSALQFLLVTLFGLLTMLFLLRFFMQLFRVSFSNPLGLMVMTLTDFAVKPARKMIPSIKKWDVSTLFLAFSMQFLLYFSLYALSGFALNNNQLAPHFAPWVNLFSMSLLGLVKAVIDLFFYVILLQAILSWVNPQTPVAGVLDGLSRPILTPIRKLLPVVNGLDFSSFVALILLQMINVAVIGNLLARFL